MPDKTEIESGITLQTCIIFTSGGSREQAELPKIRSDLHSDGGLKSNCKVKLGELAIKSADLMNVGKN